MSWVEREQRTESRAETLGQRLGLHILRREWGTWCGWFGAIWGIRWLHCCFGSVGLQSFGCVQCKAWLVQLELGVVCGSPSGVHVGSASKSFVRSAHVCSGVEKGCRVYVEVTIDANHVLVCSDTIVVSSLMKE
ncbi:hypothetical protein VNO80_13056 [Phaseolus coccineus]|uniref:Uncharacterized protein n=1 Tax=Phaseolus coccineus TaxID=3886 RepID=A0AAN9N6Y2_PHACN